MLKKIEFSAEIEVDYLLSKGIVDAQHVAVARAGVADVDAGPG